MPGKAENRAGSEGRRPDASKATARTAEIVQSPSGDRGDKWRKLADLMWEIQHSEQSVRDGGTRGVRVQRCGTTATDAGGASLLGVLGRCALDGCDVHRLSWPSCEIVEHYRVGQPVSAEFEAARTKLMCSPDTVVAVLIYNDHLEYVRLDGTVSR